MVLAAFGGLRSAEIERISWDHIRLVQDSPEDMVINLDAKVAKTDSRRSVPIHNTLRFWLNPYIKPHKAVWSGSHDRFHRMQQKIAKKAGVGWKQNALRHTCISARVAITKDLPKVAYESGNSVAIIKQNYLDLMVPSVASDWFEATFGKVADYREELAKQMTRKAKASPTAAKP